MVWNTFFWHCLVPLIPLEGIVVAVCFINVLSDHLHHVMQHFFPTGRGIFLDDNAKSTGHVLSQDELRRRNTYCSCPSSMDLPFTGPQSHRAFVGLSVEAPKIVVSASITSM